MLSVYVPRGTTLERVQIGAGDDIPEDAVWLDLVTPAPAEDKLIERAIGVLVPTREEMQEIEVTSRLYVENGALFMTATLLCQSESENPKTTAVTFVLAGHRLITVRYDEPHPFTIVSTKVARSCPPSVTGEMVLLDLLDAIIDRAADILEKISADVEQVSREIFEPEDAGPERSRSYHDILRAIGRKGDLTSKARESLVSINRVLLYVANEADNMEWAKDQRVLLKGMQRDVVSLSDHATYLANKITFVLDAMLGIVSLDQNNIIKIFSVAAVVFMPPTLIASIYGMNFKHLPELDFDYGYPMAIVMMIAAAVMPYLFFKWKKWL
jgi:magnesium transporter